MALLSHSTGDKENALPPRIIAKDKDLTLKTIEKSTALEKLKMYVEAYLQSQQQIQLIPTENIAKFIEKMKVRSILTIF